MDVPDLEADFPSLFATGSGGRRVPTLLLHGDRRVRRGYAEEASQEEPYRLWKEVVQDTSNVEALRGWQRAPFWEYPAMDARVQVGGRGWERVRVRFGLRFTIPTPTTQPKPIQIQIHQQVQSVVSYFSDQSDAPRRSLGTFHPKICLLVTRARLVVVVSTANLGFQATADLSWVQAFPRRSHTTVSAQQQGGRTTAKTSFGRALTDLLARIEESLGHQAAQCRKDPAGGEAAAAGTVAKGPLAFLRRGIWTRWCVNE